MSSRSLRSSKLKEMKKNVEMKKQVAELAQYEAEMEKKKIDIEMQKTKMAREIRFKAQQKKSMICCLWKMVTAHLMKRILLLKMRLTTHFLLNLNYQSKNRQPAGLPAVTRKLPKGP